MLEMKSRLSQPGYSPVRAEDDEEEEELEEEVPVRKTPSIVHRRHYPPREPPRGCAQCCFIFSLSGLIFLSILAFLVLYNTQYMGLKREVVERKEEIATNICVAAGMYLLCMLLSAYVWCCQGSHVHELEDGRFDD